MKTILAIETSCDETAAAVLKYENTQGFPTIQTLSSVVKSQIETHAKMGGVVPEAAARAHVKNILPVVKKALNDADRHVAGLTANTDGKKIDYIAVTQGPGLIPSLIVGVEFAKALAFATKTPLLPINHMAGHLYSPFRGLDKQQTREMFPQIALIVSGGHTMLVVVEDLQSYKVIGETVDDAAGEAFDKVARILGLPYPGGPEVSKRAEGSKDPITFPRPMINSKNYNFSFSGLKTAVLYYVQSLKTKNLTEITKSNICRGFEDAAVEVLLSKTLRAAKEFKAKSISVSGGVSANKALRFAISTACEKNNLKIFLPTPELCTDNAEMIGLAAAFGLSKNAEHQNVLSIQANPNLPF